MSMTRRNLLSLALIAAAAVAPATAGAAIKNPQANAAIKKGVRDVARYSVEGGATASKIQITCQPVKKVNQKGHCMGSFRLTKDGRTADYTLTSKARVFRISPGAIEYRVAARIHHETAGFPTTTDLAGFYQ
jgi:hypothetical protein